MNGNLRIVLVGTAIIFSTLSSVIAYSRGYVDGTVMGIREGQSDALAKAAGKCFRKIEDSL